VSRTSSAESSVARLALAVDDQRDPVGGRGDALAHDRGAQQGVDQRRLAGVELADDHQQEQPLEVVERGREVALALAAELGAGDERPQVADRGALALQQVAGGLGQRAESGRASEGSMRRTLPRPFGNVGRTLLDALPAPPR
jgi:hypothetical protein